MLLVHVHKCVGAHATLCLDTYFFCYAAKCGWSYIIYEGQEGVCMCDMEGVKWAGGAGMRGGYYPASQGRGVFLWPDN